MTSFKNLTKRTEALRAQASARISQIFLSELFSLKIPGGMVIASFRGTDDEIDTTEISEQLFSRKLRLAFPRITDFKAAEMEMVEAKNFDPENWEENKWGIVEPAACFLPVEMSKIALILVPGVAFGEKGERRGRGKGFYDRFLARAPHALRVGITFDDQFVPSLPQSQWDQKMDWVITEKRDVKLASFKEKLCKLNQIDRPT